MRSTRAKVSAGSSKVKANGRRNRPSALGSASQLPLAVAFSLLSFRPAPRSSSSTQSLTSIDASRHPSNHRWQHFQPYFPTIPEQTSPSNPQHPIFHDERSIQHPTPRLRCTANPNPNPIPSNASLPHSCNPPAAISCYLCRDIISNV